MQSCGAISWERRNGITGTSTNPITNSYIYSHTTFNASTATDDQSVRPSLRDSSSAKVDIGLAARAAFRRRAPLACTYRTLLCDISSVAAVIRASIVVPRSGTRGSLAAIRDYQGLGEMRWRLGRSTPTPAFSKRNRPGAAPATAVARPHGAITTGACAHRPDISTAAPGEPCDAAFNTADSLLGSWGRRQRESDCNQNTCASPVSCSRESSKSGRRSGPSTEVKIPSKRPDPSGADSSTLGCDKRKEGDRTCCLESDTKEREDVNAVAACVAASRVGENIGQQWTTAAASTRETTAEEHLLVSELCDHVLRRGVVVDHFVASGSARVLLALMLSREMTTIAMQQTGPDELVALASISLDLSAEATSSLLAQLVDSEATAARLASQSPPTDVPLLPPDAIWNRAVSIAHAPIAPVLQSAGAEAKVAATVAATALVEACRAWEDILEAIHRIASVETVRPVEGRKCASCQAQHCCPALLMDSSCNLPGIISSSVAAPAASGASCGQDRPQSVRCEPYRVASDVLYSRALIKSECGFDLLPLRTVHCHLEQTSHGYQTFTSPLG